MSKLTSDYICNMGNLVQELHHQIYSRFDTLNEKEQSMHVMNKNWRNVIADALVLLGKDIDGDVITIQGYTFITNLKYGIIIRPNEEYNQPLPENAYMIKFKSEYQNDKFIIFANSEEEALNIAKRYKIDIQDITIINDEARLISNKNAYLFLF